MIYEIFGMPGSGKSTCCKMVQKYGIKNPIEFFRNNFFGKVLFHIFLKTFFLDKEIKKYFKNIKCIIGDMNKYINIYNSNISIELYVKYMLFSFFIEKKMKKNIIIDEGIFHFCVAMYAEFNLEEDKIYDIIDIFEWPIEKKVIYLKCSINTAITQTNKRSRKRATIDYLEEKDLRLLYEKYYKICEILSVRSTVLFYNEIEMMIKKEKYEN